MRPIDADALLEKECCGRISGNDVRNAPTIDAELVRHGRWIRQDNTYTRYMCSECESKNHGDREKYCPNCGAKQDLEEE